MFHLKKMLLIIVVVAFTPRVFSYDLKECSDEYCVKIFKDFKKYARQGHPSAMETLGNFYMVGYGIEKDPRKALSMYKKAGKWDQASAQYKTGLIYLSQMVDDDPSRGITYLKEAVKNKFYQAAYVLGAVYLEGELVEQDYEEASEWLELASEHNIYKASYLLGKMYDSQLFGEEQKDKAIPLYNKAAYKIAAARDRLKELNQPMPQGSKQDIERIVVNNQNLHDFFDEQLAQLRNTQAPKVGTGSRIAGQTCEKIWNCNSISGEDARRFLYEIQRVLGLSF